MNKRKKRNIIIGLLCAVVLLMGVGYAAFSTVLNINGTSNITSNWNIKITNITSKNIVGKASNNGEPTFADLSATFKTNLISPGDSIEYEVTVTNTGNMNAILNKITLSDTNNPAIKFTTSGLTEGDVINIGSTGTLNVKVEYLSTITSDPSSKESSLTVKLDYSQVTSGGAPGGESAADKLIKTAVTSGDGLYKDTYESGRYIYRGTNPNNYITFNNETWRIISVENDGTLKIIRNESAGKMPWDVVSNDWKRPSNLNNYLNNDYFSTLSKSSKEKIISHSFNVGGIKYLEKQIIEDDINQIKAEKWEGNVGLLDALDYIKASLNPSCDNFYSAATDPLPCKKLNYLYDSTNEWWLISKNDKDNRKDTVWYVSSSGNVFSYNGISYESPEVYPALYLKSDIKLSGEGTSSNPYIIG